MTQSRSEKANLIASLAARLRMIQFDMADEEPQVRRDYLADELKRSLVDVAPHERPRFLEQLQTQFPSWDTQVDVASVVTEAPPHSGVDESELEDASFLVTRLMAIAPTLSEPERQVVKDRLASVGLSEVDSALPWQDEAAEALAGQLGLGGAENVTSARALAAMDLLVTGIMDLDRMAYTTWREIAPRERLKDPTRLKNSLAKWFSGDPDVSRSEIAESLDLVRRMVASMILAIRNAPREWAHNHLATYSVTAIDDFAKIEKGKFLEAHEVKCWKKYRELAEGMDELSVSREILQTVAEYASRILDSARE